MRIVQHYRMTGEFLEIRNVLSIGNASAMCSEDGAICNRIVFLKLTTELGKHLRVRDHMLQTQLVLLSDLIKVQKRAWGNLFFENSSRAFRGELGMCQLASTKIASLTTFEGFTRSGAAF